jgi:small nuclear ribonucleoprotein (snRNP)-like protein
MLPLTLLKSAENHPMLIELKNGDTYNGRLVSCNVFMNVCLKDVICTSKVTIEIICFNFVDDLASLWSDEHTKLF